MRIHVSKDGKETPLNRLTNERLLSLINLFMKMSQTGYFHKEKKEWQTGVTALISLGYYDYLVEYRRRKARKDSDMQNLIKLHDHLDKMETYYQDEESPKMKAYVSELIENLYAEPTYNQLLDALDALYHGDGMAVAQDLLIYAGRLEREDAKVISPLVPELNS
jgi:hypothetical protein